MNLTKFTLPLILFILTAASGFWVSKTGKPYSTGIFTLHKLIGLAMVVLSVIAVVNLLKITPTPSLIVMLFILAGLSTIALFTSGSLMSALKSPGSIWLLIHRMAPFLLAGSTAAAILLLNK
jgi:hypothetical protein